MEQYRILLVDDDIQVRQALVYMLQSSIEIQFDIIETDRLHSALGELTDSTIDAVILDFELPDSGGVEGVSCIRAINKKVVIIVLSGYMPIREGAKAIKLGADFCIRKPLLDAENFILGIPVLIARRELYLINSIHKVSWWKRYKTIAKIITTVGTITGAIWGAIKLLLNK